jgi:hypothetical protein
MIACRVSHLTPLCACVCLQKNPRFVTYCPYCQISTTPSTLPQGLKEPPSYATAAASSSTTRRRSSSSRSPGGSSTPPPPYSASAARAVHDEKSAPLDGPGGDGGAAAQDALHFLNHDHDTITSLALSYGVPPAALRRANNITSDHLLLGRRTVIIPAEFYKGGVSLSPRPIEGEDEELRKGKIRRFMVSCKVSEYDIAVLYLEQHAYNLNAATEAYVADEEWEAAHPAQGSARGKVVARDGGLGRSTVFPRSRRG